MFPCPCIIGCCYLVSGSDLVVITRPATKQNAEKFCDEINMKLLTIDTTLKQSNVAQYLGTNYTE